MSICVSPLSWPTLRSTLLHAPRNYSTVHLSVQCIQPSIQPASQPASLSSAATDDHHSTAQHRTAHQPQQPTNNSTDRASPNLPSATHRQHCTASTAQQFADHLPTSSTATATRCCIIHPRTVLLVSTACLLSHSSAANSSSRCVAASDVVLVGLLLCLRPAARPPSMTGTTS